MDNSVFVLHSCNEWKEYSSFRTIGVFNDEKALKDALEALYKEDDIGILHETIKETKERVRFENSGLTAKELKAEIDSEIEGKIEQLREMDIREIADTLTYASLESYTLNELV